MRDLTKDVLGTITGRIKYYFEQNGYDKEIKIFENLGNVKNDYKEKDSDTIHRTLYGVIRQTSSQIGAVADSFKMLTASAVLEFLVDAVQNEEEKYPEVDTVVSLLRACSNYITGDWFETLDDHPDHDGSAMIRCAVMPVVSLPTVGFYQEASSNFGSFMPVSVQISFTAVHNAMVPSAVTLSIDGNDIVVSDMVISRAKTATTDTHVNSITGSTVNSDDSSTLEVQIACPAQYAATESILSELIEGGTNIPHCVQIGVGNGLPKKLYLMEYAKTQLTKTANATIGLNVNLLELDPQCANISTASGWKRVTLNVGDNLMGSVPVTTGKWCIFWGDGISQGPLNLTGSGNVEHQYSKPGVYTAVYYKQG